MSRMFFVVESDHHKTRGHQTRVRDVRGSPELHEDEHLPGELWPLVLAKIKVRYCMWTISNNVPSRITCLYLYSLFYWINFLTFSGKLSVVICYLIVQIHAAAQTESFQDGRRECFLECEGAGEVVLEKLEIVEMKEVLICRATWITLPSPRCDPPSLLRDVNLDNVIARLLQIR